MIKFRLTLVLAVAWLLVLVPTGADAASGAVIIVAEGLSPQVLDLGKAYIRNADDNAQLSTSLNELKEKAKPAAFSLTHLKGILQTAHNNGYATGLVTTGDISKIAPMFYKLNGDVTAGLTAQDAPFEFLAGGGAANLTGASDKMAANGDTFVASADALDGQLIGRVLAAQTPGELNYAIDRDPALESGLGELATTALDVLSSGDKPFVLVIHDSLLKRALDSKDTPALFEQFRELNTLVGDIAARRDDDPNLKIAVLMTGASSAPVFSTTSVEEQNSAFSVISSLQKSFAGAGQSLRGKTVEDITVFADADAGDYRGWNISESDKEKIADGTLDPESALRAWYEPILKFRYDATLPQSSAFTLGFEAPGDLMKAPDGLMEALRAAVALPVK